jgi:hypothetical protein
MDLFAALPKRLAENTMAPAKFVDFDDIEDPLDPLNWPMPKKYTFQPKGTFDYSMLRSSGSSTRQYWVTVPWWLPSQAVSSLLPYLHY